MTVNGVRVVSTLDMWQTLEVRRHALMELIHKYEDDFKEFGTLSFQFKKGRSAGRPVEYCFLNEAQCILLITLMRNSKVIVDLKKQIVKGVFRLKDTVQVTNEKDS